MNPEQLQEDVFHLLAFMLTSARGLYEEPPDYAAFRLLDAAGRLLEILHQHALLNDPFLLDLKQKIDAERYASMDNQRQQRMLDEWILSISEELRRRLG